MSTNELGGGMHQDVRSMLQWATQIGRCEGIIDDERHSRFVGNIGDGADVQYVASRVANGFAIEDPYTRCNRAPVVFGIGAINENSMNAPGAQDRKSTRLNS